MLQQVLLFCFIKELSKEMAPVSNYPLQFGIIESGRVTVAIQESHMVSFLESWPLQGKKVRYINKLAGLVNEFGNN